LLSLPLANPELGSKSFGNALMLKNAQLSKCLFLFSLLSVEFDFETLKIDFFEVFSFLCPLQVQNLVLKPLIMKMGSSRKFSKMQFFNIFLAVVC